MQQPCRHRQAEHVVAECPKEILANVAHSRSRERQCREHGLHAVPHEHNIARLCAHVHARAHSHAHIGGSQGRGIVDAVAHHAHHVALILHPAHIGGLVCGQQPRGNFLHACQSGHGFCGALIVTRQHDHAHAHAAQGRHHRGGFGPQGVRKGQNTRKAGAAIVFKSQQQGRLPGLGQQSQLLLRFFRHGKPALSHECSVAHGKTVVHAIQLHPARNTHAGRYLHIIHRQ